MVGWPDAKMVDFLVAPIVGWPLARMMDVLTPPIEGSLVATMVDFLAAATVVADTTNVDFLVEPMV